MLNLLRFEIASRRNATLGWGVGLTLFGLLYIGLYPEVAGLMADIKDISIYRAMGIDLGGFEGYLASTAIQFAPVILGIYAILAGTGALAGEEDDGTLELVVASPLKRWQILLMKAVALGLSAFVILLIASLADVLVVAMIDVETAVTSGALIGAVLNAWPLTFAFMMISVWLGTVMPSRRLAALTATAIFIASYFGRMATNMVTSLDPLKKFLLFNYFDASPGVLIDGVQGSDVLVLLAVALVFLGLGLVGFQRRNITVGAWPWQ